MGFTYFPQCYFSSVEKFRSAAKARGATLFCFPLSVSGPENTTLSVDIAWLGDDRPDRCVVHVAGTHGIEGLTGAAIQHAYLDRELSIPSKCAVVLVHCLNPFGMVYGRRQNENNVDLNRNCHADPAHYQQNALIYKAFHDVVLTTGFSRHQIVVQLARLVLQHSYPEVRQAFLGGQHSHPDGLFYGGRKKEESVAILETFLRCRLPMNSKTCVLEVHTSMGRYGTDSLYYPRHPRDPMFKDAERFYGTRLIPDVPTEAIGFRTKGDLATGMPAILGERDIRWAVQEIGTYHPVAIFRGARREHLAFIRNGPTYPNAYDLTPLFNPVNKVWRTRAVELGLGAFVRLIRNFIHCSNRKVQ